MFIQTSDGEFCIRFAIASLATWRVSHLLRSEDGPGDILFRLRTSLGSGFFGKLMDCFYCLSLWVAAPFVMTVSTELRHVVPVWLAISGAACLLERATAPPIAMELSRPADLEMRDEL